MKMKEYRRKLIELEWVQLFIDKRKVLQWIKRMMAITESGNKQVVNKVTEKMFLEITPLLNIVESMTNNFSL